MNNIMIIIQKWINEGWKKDTIQVMDDASMLKINIVKDKNKECKTKISTYPGWLTRYLNL